MENSPDGVPSTAHLRDATGAPWFSWRDGWAYLYVSNYVGGSSGNCTSTAWNCTKIDDASDSGGGAGNHERYTSLMFDNNGTAWISYHHYTATHHSQLRVAKYVGAGGTGCVAR